MKSKIKILFVGFPFSIHSARWISNFQCDDFDIHFFSSVNWNLKLNNNFCGVTYHVNKYYIRKIKNNTVKPIDIVGYLNFGPFINEWISRISRKLKIESSINQGLSKVISSVQPRIIHSFESQNAGYLLSDYFSTNTKECQWIHSIWGIDFEFYIKGHLHKKALVKMLTRVDTLIVEGSRDLEYARSLGFAKRIEILQATGGIILGDIEEEQRNIILLKGYDEYPRLGMLGFLAVLKVIELIKHKGYKVIIYDVGDSLKRSLVNIEHLKYPITCVENMGREEFLKLNNSALISININDTDGMPNCILEAMAYGAFPIASDKSCLSDIIENGLNGFVTNPLDVNEIANCISLAIENPSLLNKSFSYNRKVIKEKYNYDDYKKKIQQLYFNSLY